MTVSVLCSRCNQHRPLQKGYCKDCRAEYDRSPAQLKRRRDYMARRYAARKQAA